MNTLLKSTILTILLLNTMSYAGSKGNSLAESSVVPVPEDISSWYLGFGLVAAKFHSCGDGCDYEDMTYGAMLRGGYDFNAYLGLEARG